MNIQKKINLANFTSFGVGGKAEYFCELSSASDILGLSDENIDYVLGYGANVLVSDKGLKGLTVLLRNGSCSPLLENNTSITVDAACNWDAFVAYAIEHELWGIELMSGIPGGVGAAVVGNIAAYGQAVADTLVSVKVLNTSTKETKIIPSKKLALTYRNSSFQTPENSDLVILNATFNLSNTKTTDLTYEGALAVARESAQDTNSLLARRHIIMETRRRAGSLLEPNGLKTAGSFFRNPLVKPEQVDLLIAHDETGRTKEQIAKMNKVHGGDSMRVSAAHVLLAAGFKRGQTWGNVRLHPDHVLKIENTGQATSQDIYDVSQEIILTVKQKLNIVLKPEVRFIGEFNDRRS